MKRPKYQLIKEELQSQILSDHYHVGDKFFTEAELLERFQVSSITIIRALKELEKEGFINRKQGLGSFIARTRREKLVQFAYLDSLEKQIETIRVLSLTKGNDPCYLKLLELHKTEYYYILTRERTINGKPYLYQLSYIPHDYLLSEEADLDAYQSLYKRFFLDFNIRMANQTFHQETCLTNQMPPAVKAFFKLADASPCVLQTKLTRFKDNQRILEYAKVYKHWECFKYQLSSSDYH
ncbi:GntR family transcriptional regulator [Streptococcus canis]|uniref:GntR family transcriptional regulator n=1 Tax=Streptococcus canis TaxID=1329 RepID=UPI0013DD5548|nr:GntR family transcriptional regulator [Streptococcus canis]QKG75862.1 GntR family transcriptional regulator [Streptococcus canis]